MNITAYPIDQSVNDAAMVLLGLNHKTSSDAQRLELTRATARSEASLLTKRQCSTTYLLRKRPLLHDTTLEQQPTKRMRPMKRSARFGDDPSVAPSVQLHVFESVDHENANLIWWTRDEIRHIHRRERAMIGVLSQCCGFYVEQLACLTRVSFEDTVDLSKETSYAWVADSPGRGLETQVAAVLTGSTDKARIVTRKVWRPTSCCRSISAEEDKPLLHKNKPVTFSGLGTRTYLCGARDGLSYWQQETL
ncbi:expressed unknown protein [Seminavis robusta]|uniref:Uncharacterized protein n=1 Tax=Seminavis robusta TaxID=568900 RepID=A0A9N8ETP9_9STRA|nr:expressed unknown protein [Seminavis robusta]|eukprot:Sro1938_g306490.1 n/a (249) ;mRNA; r:896-1642